MILVHGFWVSTSGSWGCGRPNYECKNDNRQVEDGDEAHGGGNDRYDRSVQGSDDIFLQKAKKKRLGGFFWVIGVEGRWEPGSLRGQ